MTALIHYRASAPAGRCGSAAAFSLVEITLAMGIAAVAMVTILGMLPHAMKYGREGADQTAIGAVLEDVHDRLKGSRLSEGEVAGSPFFYDQQGRHWTAEPDQGESLVDARFFRAEVKLVRPTGRKDAEFPDEMLMAVVELHWPVDALGEPLNQAPPRTTVVYPVTTLTGPQWQVIDPTYQPKVEY